jgi:hypothetical protein
MYISQNFWVDHLFFENQSKKMYKKIPGAAWLRRRESGAAWPNDGAGR